MRSTIVRAIAVALLLALVFPLSASAAGLSATLDGKRLRLDRVPEFNCHDFDYPVIRCFSSPEGISADVAARLEGGPASARLLLGGYVTAYEDSGYLGSSISLSADYASLGSIGWNDRISSFKSFGAVGGFWEHSPPAGFYYGYTTNTQVSNLGTYNDRFSAFDIT